MLRTLIHHWRVNVAVVLGAAVATAVLAGALLVGDSVRASLRAMTLERLGKVDEVFGGDRFFREELADDVRSGPERSVVPVISLEGAVEDPAAGARASGVSVWGIDERFGELFSDPTSAPEPDETTGGVFPPAIVNRALANELGIEVGGTLLLTFGRWSEVPRETLLGDTDAEDVVGSLRLTVTDVIDDRGPGRFGLRPHQHTPFNLFVTLDRLQRVLDRPGRVNLLLVEQQADADSASEVAAALTLADYGITVEPGDGFLSVASDAFVLDPETESAVLRAAGASGGVTLPIQSYLANAIASAGHEVPYSAIAALDAVPGAPWSTLRLAGGEPAPAPGADGVLLNTWTARRLGVRAGDEVTVRYWVVGPREELREDQQRFRVAGVVAMAELGGDPALTPDYPGLQDADDIAEWDPPFPVDLDRIHDEDEAYWDEHRATPKAFFAREVGRRLWGTRFGDTTSVRVGVPEGESVGAFEARFRRTLLAELDPGTFGLGLRAVKDEGLRASEGATDFGQLFIGFSSFLIVSAALLVALLFRLGVERRAREIGLLLGVGYPRLRVLRGLLAEGATLAAVGGVVGLAGAVGYAWLMMAGLRSLWRSAVGSSLLFLSVDTVSLAIGWLISVVVVLVSIALAARQLVRLDPPRLLAGAVRIQGRSGGGRVASIVATGALVVALGLLVGALAGGEDASAGLAFGTGAALLISGLAAFWRWCGRSGRGTVAGVRGGLARMAVRNSSWSPGRSMLSVALVAVASFVIVTVAASRSEPRDTDDRGSETGGFDLIAETDVPIHHDLQDVDGLFELGFEDEDARALAGAETYGLRLLPGDDASCLNLYRPEKPRVLGVPDALIGRGGFSFKKTAALADGDDPWMLLDRSFDDGAIPAFADASSAQWILKVGLGDDVVVDDGRGGSVRLRLVGLLAGGLFQSELLVSEASFVDSFPDRAGHAVFLIDAGGAEGESLGPILERTLAPWGFDAMETRERIARFKEVEHTYLSTFQLLGGFGLLLGTVGLAVVLVRNLLDRRAELATLRAFGFRRSRIGWLVAGETAFLLAVGLSIGTLSALGAVTPRLTSIRVSWPSLALTLAIVAGVGMLASIVALVPALRVPLLPALKSER